MSPSPSTPLLSARASTALGWSVLFVLLVVRIVTFPLPPLTDLDSSWRMALGYFFAKGMQFGQDVIFTYGPLGFIMSKTYSGVQYGSIIAGQLALALISATVLVCLGRRLQGSSRFVYFGYFLLFGTIYEDALHMVIIAILGFELLRMADRPQNWLLVSIAGVLAVYAQIKFTDLLLATFIVLVAVGFHFWRGRRREAAALALAYGGAFLAVWLACGQNPLNLPAFFYGSWQISEGYQWAMAVPTAAHQLWPGLVLSGILAGYICLHLRLNPDKPRAVANALLLAAFTYLNWKHGFVRPDGHLIGFYICALLPIAAYPALLDDPPRFQPAYRWAFVFTLIFGLWSLENAYTGAVQETFFSFQEKTWAKLEKICRWQQTRARYQQELAGARRGSDLAVTRKVVGRATLDVLGFEQGVALFNDFNYHPRPLIQGYFTFTPYLAKLNGDFYASPQAPEFVLMKLQAIDGRLPTMDDAQVLALLAQRYEFVHAEKNFQLWRRHPGAFDPAQVALKRLRTESLKVNQPLEIDAASQQQPLWLRVDLPPSLLGKLRSFLYKPPQVRLGLQDAEGKQHDFLLPLPQGRNGFIVNPLIEDIVDYMQFAGNRGQKRVKAIILKIAPGEEKYFAGQAQVELSTLPVAHSAGEYFRQQDAGTLAKLFHMFHSCPLAYEAHVGFVESLIGGIPVAMMHAPSQMIFEVPAGATMVSGRFGFLESAYSNGGFTNGARFIIYGSDGTNRIDLFEKFLNPVSVPADRGLHDFSVQLKVPAGMRLYLETNPGPNNDNSWDWTCWTEITIAP